MAVRPFILVVQRVSVRAVVRVLARCRVARNQPCAALIGHIIPGPFDQYQQAIFELDEIHQVDEEPNELGESSPQFKSPQIRPQ